MEIPVRAVGNAGDTVDFMFQADRDGAAAWRHFEEAIDQNCTLRMVSVTKNRANLAVPPFPTPYN